MITHRVIDLVYTEEEGNVVMNGSKKECNDFIASQSDAFTYQVQPLLKHEIDSLNEYDLALKIGETYRKWGNRLIAIILFLSSYTTKAQNIYEDKTNYVVMGFHAGYDIKISAPIAGLQVGYKLGNVFTSLNTLIPVTSNALAPKMVTFQTGYNIGSFQPHIGAAFQTIGKEKEQYFRGKEGEFLNGWRMVYGLSYYPVSIPLSFTVQQQGKQSIFLISLYKAL